MRNLGLFLGGLILTIGSILLTPVISNIIPSSPYAIFIAAFPFFLGIAGMVISFRGSD